jgi:hypothetical protein
MTDERTYTGVGTSMLSGAIKFRFANGNLAKRIATLIRLGHTEVDLIELPIPMDKEAAIAFYQNSHPESLAVRKPNDKIEKTNI